jgi:FkbM family methyltransferase
MQTRRNIMIQTLARLFVLHHRKQSARRLGFNFRRAADFKLPSEIRMNSRNLHLNLPDDMGTQAAFIDLLLDDCYRLRKLPGDLEKVLDIGAHAGLFGLAARLHFPNAEIHSYEPNPKMQSFLSNQADVGRFLFFNYAVGLVEGRMSLDTCADTVQTRTHRSEQGEIQCVSFASAVARLNGAVDLVKLDCEGAEWEILQDEAAWKNVRNLTMEFHLWAGYKLEELKARITGLGFQIRCAEMTGPDFGILVAAR